MPVIRVDKTKDYTAIPKCLLLDKNLSLKAIGLMCVILSLPPEQNITVEGLTSVCKEGRSCIRNLLSELEENGYLKVAIARLTKDTTVSMSNTEGRNRNTPEYRVWRKSVFERDNYTCQMCGKKGGELNAHHIKLWKSHPESRYDIKNGVTLCESCHKEYHKKYGRK